MSKPKSKTKIAVALLTAALLVLPGCGIPAALIAAFSLGALLGQSSESNPPIQVVLERTCYRNGEPVDCAEFGVGSSP